MAARSSDVPDVRETDLDRSDLEEAARELGIEDIDDLDDQALFERIGVGLGEIDEEQLDHDDEAVDADEEPEATDEEPEEPEATDEEPEEPEATDEEPEEPEATDEEPEEPEATDEEPEERHPVHDEGEYRVEDDPREGIEPVIDLELGPLAIDVLGLEIHLNRLHAAITANPGPDHAVIGKLLARIARLLESVGLGKLTDQITDAVGGALDALPDGGGGADSEEADASAEAEPEDEEAEEAEETEEEDEEAEETEETEEEAEGAEPEDEAEEAEPEDEGGGLLDKLTGPVRGLSRSVSDTLGRRR